MPLLTNSKGNQGTQRKTKSNSVRMKEKEKQHIHVETFCETYFPKALNGSNIGEQSNIWPEY